VSLPTLVYDEDCGFCRYWVAYWDELTGSAVRYVPYQQIGEEFPALKEIDCRAAIQLITADGRRTNGAEAGLAILSYAGRSEFLNVYRKSKSIAWCCDAGYRLIATHRSLALALAKLLWGNARHPVTFNRASGAFIRFISLIYIVAFFSFGWQIIGLIGAQGITPLHDYLPAVRRTLGADAYWQLPSIFWLNDNDLTLIAVCAFGALAGFAGLVGFAERAALVVAYLLYLSLFYAGQAFMSFQWDLLLLEAGFLAILATTRRRITPFLFRLLLFRFMFLSGCVKLLSGDPSWHSLAALEFHYETQPLPTILAWYIHQAPALIHHLSVVVTLVIEIALPLLIFAPRRPRMLAAAGFIGLELLILLSGNYNFFNLLTIGLTIFLFDDHQLRSRAASAPQRLDTTLRTRGGRTTGLAVGAIAAWIIVVGLYETARPLIGGAMPTWIHRAARLTQPLHITNSYGLFAVMTTTRSEIIVEGSTDGREWRTYDFRYKPGALSQPPSWVAPHQPRLDWQMWFAALGTAKGNPWFGNFLYRLLSNETSVTNLLAHNPFATAPPRYVRALLYEYRFSTRLEKQLSGNWWIRKLVGLYYPPIHLKTAIATKRPRNARAQRPTVGP